MTLKNLLERTFNDTDLSGEVDLSGEDYGELAKLLDNVGGVSKLKALAAALAYGMDEGNAKKIIIQGQYTFFDVDNNCQLGKAILKKMGGNLPDGIAEYFDYKRLGKDFCEHTRGQLTHYGFFTPREFSHLWWLK